jgi:D-alanine-D-alanine ligase
MVKLGLIFGGRSAEHEISVKSARFVHAQLDPERYEVTLIGITRDGAWILPRDTEAALEDGLDDVAFEPVSIAADPRRPGLHVETDGRFVALDFAFPILHGTFGEDGTIQGLLEMVGLAYAGSGVAATAVGMDKELMKAVFAANGLPQVDYMVLRDRAAASAADLAAIEKRFSYPVFVKPVNLGSSVGMTKAHDRAELEAALSLALLYDRKAIIEATAVGRELECSLLGNEQPRASVAGEVVPANEFYDYEAKYTEGKMAFSIPAPISDEQQQSVRELAVNAFRAIDCAGFARCDFFLEEPSGRVLINEINTIPGMTAMSGFPRLWAASGVDGRELVETIVRLGMERGQVRARLATSREAAGLV